MPTYWPKIEPENVSVHGREAFFNVLEEKFLSEGNTSTEITLKR